jgi:hypothetical protein
MQVENLQTRILLQSRDQGHKAVIITLATPAQIELLTVFGILSYGLQSSQIYRTSTAWVWISDSYHFRVG